MPARVISQARWAFPAVWNAFAGSRPTALAVLLSVPGMGPILAPTVRALLADGTHLNDAKAARSFVGLNPSNWSSGQMESPSRAITKEGPPVLGLAFYQAAKVARAHDPHLADFYRRLMIERGHCHTKANQFNAVSHRCGKYLTAVRESLRSSRCERGPHPRPLSADSLG